MAGRPVGVESDIREVIRQDGTQSAVRSFLVNVMKYPILAFEWRIDVRQLATH